MQPNPTPQYRDQLSHLWEVVAFVHTEVLWLFLRRLGTLNGDRFQSALNQLHLMWIVCNGRVCNG